MVFDLRNNLIAHLKSSKQDIFYKIKEMDKPAPNGIQKFREHHFCQILAESMYWTDMRETFA